MRFKRTLAVAAATVGTLAAVGLPAASAHAAGTVTSVTLPINQFSHMLVDSAHQHLFISGSGGDFTPGGGTTSTGIMVTDYSGQEITFIPDTGAASAMSISSDGSTVYAVQGSYVDVINADTLTYTTRYFLGSGVSATSAVYAGGKIWFSYQPTFPSTDSDGAIESGIGSIDPSVIPTTFPANGAGEVTGPGISAATVTFNATNDPAGTWGAAPLLALSSSGELVAAGTQDPSVEEPFELAGYDVSSGAAAVVVPPVQVATGINVQDLQITPDGKDVVVASGSPYAQQVFQLSDMSLVGQYPTAEWPVSVSITANGTVVAGAGGVSNGAYVYAPGGSAPLNTYSFGTNTLHSAEITPDGSDLFAITSTTNSLYQVMLNIIPDPAQTASTLSVRTRATERKPRWIRLTGTLGGPAPYVGGQTLTVTRVDPADPNGVALPDVTTNADGTYTITDHNLPKVEGNSETITYQVSYAGNAYLTSSSASAAVAVTNS